jgi:hypothetical protein
MRNFLSGITSLWKIWWKNLWFAQKAENVLSDWFDISTAADISEADLMKIFSNRFASGTLPFFIISSQWVAIPKRKFDADTIDECYGSDWFAHIHPNSWSHILVPAKMAWIRFNTQKTYAISPFDWKVWERWWWTFQLDKNLGKKVIHTQVSINSMQNILEQALS